MEPIETMLARIINWTPIGVRLSAFQISSLAKWKRLMSRQRDDQPTSIGPLSYQKKWYLLSPAERDFYQTLRQATADRYLIFAKVRLLDLLWPPQNLANRQLHINRVQAKHVDFVLCHPQTVAPALVIELDDASHQLPERQERDIFLNEALQVVGIPLLRVPVRKSFAVPILRGQILGALGMSSRQETDAA